MPDCGTLRKWVASGCLGLAAVTASVNAVSANEIPPGLLTLLEQKDVLSQQFAEQASSCVSRQDTNHALFDGCIDWHSSVHGNWAILRYLNSGLNTPALEEAVDWLSTREGLALLGQEVSFLNENSSFERPYGRAWLLRLAIDASQRAPEANLDVIVNPVFNDLMAYVTSVEQDKYSTSYRSYSWALINLHDFAVHFELQKEQDELEAAIRSLVLVEGGFPCSYVTEAGSFMAVCTNWMMLASRVLTHEEYVQWLDQYLTLNGLPEPIVSPRNSHELGLNFSRAWGLWAAYDKSINLEVLDAYIAHFDMGHEQYLETKDNYRTAGHWVAQFGMYAIHPLLKSSVGD